ncbi:MAG TPA: O-antigen ligase family protein [Chthoniobacterales bacterium]|nr:O-antigen ligase family protein [Chthoniobacterales bacterium]
MSAGSRGSSILLRALDLGFNVGSIVLFCGGLRNILGTRTYGSTEDSALVKLLFATIYLVSLLKVLARWREFTGAAFRIRRFWAIALLVLASTAWSVLPSTTFLRAACFVAGTFFAMQLGMYYPPVRQLKLVAATLSVAGVASLIFAVGLPQYGVMHTGELAGTWCGIFTQKNELGRAMILNSLVLLVLWKSKHVASRYCVAGLLFSAILIVLARSLTSLVITGFLIACWPAMRHSQRVTAKTAVAIFMGLLMMGLLLALVGYAFRPEILGLMGKRADLTGRTRIWEFALEKLGDRPILGFGYGSFWTWAVRKYGNLQWLPTEAHNGYLELCLGFGMLGGIAILSHYIYSIRAYFQFARAAKTPESLWPVLYVIFLLSYNLAEACLVKHNNFVWILEVAIAVGLPSADYGAVES